MKYLSLCFLLLILSCAKTKHVVIVGDLESSRLAFAIDKLSGVLLENNYHVTVSDRLPENNTDRTIIIGEKGSENWNLNTSDLNINDSSLTEKEGFQITSFGQVTYIEGTDASGVLYGTLDLVDRISETKVLPDSINKTDAPEMVLRGTVIGIQKPEYLPGRTVYEYPYTPENFPWFYDKDLWIEYLDMMVDNRYNSLYLWNGHPFASLVKLDDYPFAVEVSDEDFKKNEEIFKFVTEEANKRGIWVIQMFYNILVSKPFAEHYGIKTQERSRPITPLLADYTRKSIAAFIEKYPNVGLLTTLGEAMNTIDDDVEWFTKVIIPGVQDGLQSIGETNEPPIILRGHDTDAPLVMEKALPLYKNLYTMNKYNGESLTTYEPRGPWAETHRKLSKAGSTHISNVHILANLEPFRYGSPDFIQKSVKAMHSIHGANALHLFPQTSYWDWQYAPDNTEPRLLEMERDWIWYKAWGRYAWNSQRDRTEEISFWQDQLSQKYGKGSGEGILKAYEEAGEIAPKTLRRFGITEGNRQTLLLGMFTSQLVNPYKYRVYPGFYESCGPVGEILLEYAKKEWEGEPHVGETPLQIINEIVNHGKAAVEGIEQATPYVTQDVTEFNRLKNDIYCYNLFADFFSEKVKAAMLVLRYSYSNDIEDLDQALPNLEKSVAYYQELVNHTKDTYLYANSMQTELRRIPIRGNDGKNKTWEELLPHYQKELEVFKHNIEMLKSDNNGEIIKNFKTLEPVEVSIFNKEASRFSLKKGQKVYSDNEAEIAEVAKELRHLTGVQFSDKEQQENGTVLHFKTDKAVKILVGYFNTNSFTVLAPPTLETNAQANNRGQADIKIANAMLVSGLYPVNIYSYRYEPGEHKLVLGKGRVLVLGFIDGNEKIVIHDAGITNKEEGKAIDWLFY
ncbi:hypothetical protein RBH94_03385 [Aestuariibaculum sp. YM273]|uniref:alpha-d-galacturonidase n=1 Tax=Aestuariibaculum sp. YM273 TaxID=3070659 RepID=UPI0027DD669F|nr:hypothetical protein [Aestuariibaculum sp. YM273]WMI66208.1 hypothetical protein RBH94_03385 [Aestuariibaculum sp. YM273]